MLGDAASVRVARIAVTASAAACGVSMPRATPPTSLLWMAAAILTATGPPSSAHLPQCRRLDDARHGRLVGYGTPAARCRCRCSARLRPGRLGRAGPRCAGTGRRRSGPGPRRPARRSVRPGRPGPEPSRAGRVPRQRGGGERAPAGEQGPATVLVRVPGDQGAVVAGGAVEHPGACPVHGCVCRGCPLSAVTSCCILGSRISIRRSRNLPGSSRCGVCAELSNHTRRLAGACSVLAYRWAAAPGATWSWRPCT